MLLINPELLGPVFYVLVAYETGIEDIFPHAKYCSMMKEKAIKTNNKALLKLVREYEGSV